MGSSEKLTLSADREDDGSEKEEPEDDRKLCDRADAQLHRRLVLILDAEDQWRERQFERSR
jgi:hypothetical protein